MKIYLLFFNKLNSKGATYLPDEYKCNKNTAYITLI